MHKKRLLMDMITGSCIKMSKIVTQGSAYVPEMAKLLHKDVIMIKNWQKVYIT